MQLKSKDSYERNWAFLVVVSVGWLAWSIQHSGNFVWSETESPRELTVEKLTIVNSDGEKRIVLGAPNGMPMLVMIGPGGTSNASMGVTNEGTAMLSLIGKGGDWKTELLASPDFSGMSSQRGDEKSGLRVAVMSKGSSVTLRGREGLTEVSMGTLDNGSGLFSATRGKAGAYMGVFDERGSVATNAEDGTQIWTSPSK